MDYLDPKKQFRKTIMLYVGYVLIGIAILIATVILLYQAYGFGLGKNGTVIQNGLVFFSSQPNPAHIYIDGKLNKKQTNSSLILPSGIYGIQIEKAGYRSWQRKIALVGGSVEHFDYPFLFPIKMTSTKIQSYATTPQLATQSRDQRWLLIAQSSGPSFDMFDLNNPKKAPTDVTLPATVYSASTTSSSWKVVSWADDNIHLLLQHTYDGKTEYILMDRTNPAASINLTQTYASFPFTTVTLENTKYNQFYFYDAANENLSSASLGTTTVTPVLSHVLAYTSYGDNDILYATDSDSPAGKTLIREESGGQTYDIRSTPSASNYLLDLTQYSGTFYVVVGASSENKLYVYQDPVSQLQNDPAHVAVPSQVLNVTNPNYVSFSPNAQFIVAESGQQFAVYDIENKIGYNYVATQPLDAPQAHASWMDGDRLTYSSNGKIEVFDYDYTNRQTLVAGSGQYLPFFDPNYKYLYSFAPVGKTTVYGLEQSSLLVLPGQ